MARKFNITLLDPAFGLRDELGNAQKFAVIGPPPSVVRGLAFTRLDVEVDETDIESMLGTPIYDTIEFPAGVDENGQSYNGVRLDTALITINQSKNILTTPIQGRDGTIKEYISDGDFVITISGLIVGQSLSSGQSFTMQKIGNKYPSEDVKALFNICKVKSTVQINSQFLNRFNINDVVITNYSFDQVAGKYNTQIFEINLLSDSSELILNVQ